jgi:hypothetical protein
MTVRDFSTTYNLRLTKDKDDTEVIQGTVGHIYEYGSDELGLVIVPPGNPRPRLYTSIKTKCCSAGMTLRQDGDAEDALSFYPEDKQQARMAIKVAAVRAKKRISERHKAKLLGRLQTFKNSVSGAILEGGFTC